MLKKPAKIKHNPPNSKELYIDINAKGFFEEIALLP
jgi:hypothetical protein